jgi:hypothetical protein
VNVRQSFRGTRFGDVAALFESRDSRQRPIRSGFGFETAYCVTRTRLRTSVSSTPKALSCRCKAIPSAFSSRFAVK